MSCPGPCSLSVVESELEPSTQDLKACALLVTLPLERKCGQQSLGICCSQRSGSSWRLFPTHLVGDHLHGDLVALLRLDLPARKPSSSSLTQQELSMSSGLLLASILSFSGGARRGIGSTLSPHSPLYPPGIVAWLREEQEVTRVGNQDAPGCHEESKGGLPSPAYGPGRMPRRQGCFPQVILDALCH